MIYEHRIYTFRPGKEAALIDRFHEFFPIVERYGREICAGIFKTAIGDSSELSYILGFDDLAHLQRVYESAAADEEMQNILARWAEEEPTTINTRNKVLNSTEYASSSSSS